MKIRKLPENVPSGAFSSFTIALQRVYQDFVEFLFLNVL